MPHSYTGMTRRIDDLGRIVIPAELRDCFGMHPGVKVFMEIERTALGLNLVLTTAVEDGDVGMTRKIDRVGRLVLPAEYRRKFSWEVGDFVEFIIEKGSKNKNCLVMRKMPINCVICNRSKDLITIPIQSDREVMLCRDCIRKLQSLELH